MALGHFPIIIGRYGAFLRAKREWRILAHLFKAFRLDAATRRQRITYGRDRRIKTDDVTQRARADVAPCAAADAIRGRKTCA